MIDCYFCGKPIESIQTAIAQEWWPSVWEIDNEKGTETDIAHPVCPTCGETECELIDGELVRIIE